VEVRGEILELKNTINTMVDQLSSFASEVTRVAREVEPKASSAVRRTFPACGRLERLTDSVNSMAGNLTNQVRNIAEMWQRLWRAAICQRRLQSTPAVKSSS